MSTVQELREMVEKATRGRWKCQGAFVAAETYGPHHIICSFVNCDGDTEANQRLAVAMQNHFAALLEVAEKAKATQECDSELDWAVRDQELRDALKRLEEIK